MAEKDWRMRWNDTIQYLDMVTTVGQVGTHVQSIVTTDLKRKEISEEISLGMRFSALASKDKRRALRALLLCQRVYFKSDTWSRTSESFGNPETIGLTPWDYIYQGWKEQSLNFWGSRSESAIREGIRMFEPTAGAEPGMVADAAIKGPPTSVETAGNLFLSRSDVQASGGAVTCYVGVQNWLVKSGMVSLRWFMQNAIPNGRTGCDLLFGPGVLVWDEQITAQKRRLVRTICRGIPTGSIVHIWTPDNNTWNGHWLVASGNGNACGVNNAFIEADVAENGALVPKPYTRTTTLYEQFMEYSEIGEVGHKRLTSKACMTVHYPRQMMLL